MAGFPCAVMSATAWLACHPRPHDEHGLYVRLRTRKRRAVANRRWGVVGRFGWPGVRERTSTSRVRGVSTAGDGGGSCRGVAHGRTRTVEARGRIRYGIILLIRWPYVPAICELFCAGKSLRWTRPIRLCAGLIRRPALIIRGPCVLACLESGLNPPPIPWVMREDIGVRVNFVSRVHVQIAANLVWSNDATIITFQTAASRHCWRSERDVFCVVCHDICITYYHGAREKKGSTVGDILESLLEPFIGLPYISPVH